MRRLWKGPVRLSPGGMSAAVDVMVEVPDSPGLLVVVDAPRAWRVDLGLFDPFGFRGWSGSTRRLVWVGEAGATPGYLPGRAIEGTWTVRLAAHSVPEAEAEVHLEVSAGDPLPSPEGQAELRQLGSQGSSGRLAAEPLGGLPQQGDRRWLRGDLHSHTWHSDGVLSPQELIALAGAHGLDFLAVSDHNTVSHHQHLGAAAEACGLMVIPAQEVTTDLGHAVAVGVREWIDPWSPPSEWAAATARAGGALIIAHPLDNSCSWRWPDLPPSSLIEVWNGHGSPNSGPHLRDYLERCLRLGGVGAVGGGDFHALGRGRAPGHPTTWLWAEGDDVVSALREGPWSVSASPAGPVLLPIEEDLLLALGAEGADLVALSGSRRRVRKQREEMPTNPEPHWLEAGGQVLSAWLPKMPAPFVR